MLGREGDHRGCAAKRCRHGGAVEIIGADDPGRGTLLDMAMAVDAARQHEPAGCIDLARAGGKVFAEYRNDAGPDADVADRRIGRCHDGAVADHQIVFAHGSPPRRSTTPLLSPAGQALLWRTKSTARKASP